MKRIALCLPLFMALCAFGQTSKPESVFIQYPKQLLPCNPQNINLRGLKIGATRVSIEKAMRNPIVLEESVVLTSTKNVMYEPTSKAFKGVDFVSADYYRNKVYELMFSYEVDKDIKWESIFEFVESLSKSWSVPKENWVLTKRSGSLDCGNIRVFASIDGKTGVKIEDSKLGKELRRNHFRLKEEKKKAFKP